MTIGEIIFEGRLLIPDPDALFTEYKVTPKDRRRYEQLINSNREDDAIREFAEKYMGGILNLYTTQMQDYLEVAQSGEMERRDSNMLTKSVIMLTAAALWQQKDNFRMFTKDLLAPSVFERYEITSPKVRQAILDATHRQFETLITGAMVETESNILSQIRNMQREMIVHNQMIRNKVLITGYLSRETENFKSGLRDIFPDFYKAMEDGKILKDRNGVTWKLEEYATMSTRTTLLNVERTSVEISERLDEARVVEYYLRDNRTLKTGIERIICKDVLHSDILGKSLLALDSESAEILGIMTVEEARSEGAMGPYCRHSIKPVSNTFHSKLVREYFQDAEEPRPEEPEGEE